MENSFTCTRKSYNNIGPIYISSKEEIEKITDDFIKLRCHIDDFLAANEEFKDIKGKTINYFIVMQENIEINKFKSLFNVFETLKNYSNIYGLELKLKSKISKSNFEKLVNFLTSIQQKFELKLKLGNLEVFDINQLDKLSTINNNINTNIQINQSYEGKYTDNNGYDNLYDFEKLIKIKQKVEEIVNKIPSDFNEVEKVLFLYKNLGK